MVKIYAVNSGSQPFKDGFSFEYLKSKGVEYTGNPFTADILLAATPDVKRAKIFRWLFPFKKMAYWTNEPRFNTTTDHFDTSRSCTMNVYSGNVFLHNLHFLGSYHYDFENDLGIDLASPPGAPLTMESLAAKTKFCAALYVYKEPESSRLFIDGKDISLNGARQNLAAFLYEQNKADIFGSGWPEEIKVQEESGFDAGGKTWWVRKMEVLQDYRFNICFENTAYPNYCTEKLWHAIAAGSLPIYTSFNSSVYDTFPKDSFVDASEFGSHQALLTFLENLSPEEHILRYNRCLTVMHNACKSRLTDPVMKTDVIDAFVEKISAFAKKN